MDEALLEEIEAETGLNQEEWEKTINSTGLNASYDMGWSKRSSGNRFDSISGHAFLIGCMCKKVLATQIASKKCSFCDKAAAKGDPIEPHDCTLNHEGSSKAMEADGLLQILTRLHEKHDGKVHIKAVVSDDDTTMKAVVRHESSVAKKGRLPAEIPEPKWLADPGHRIKVVAGKMYALANANKSQSTCTNLDATRFKMNFGYMLKRNRNKTLEDISKGSKAVIRHAFDDHQFCEEEWCMPTRKKRKISHLPNESIATDDRRPDNTSHPPQSERPSYYCDIIAHRQLYESLHPFDTQVNEMLNHLVAKYAPKNKCLGTTLALTHRVYVALGVHNLGHLNFWKRVYQDLQMAMSTLLQNHLSDKDKKNR